MPELPEVETVRRGLAQTLTGQRITQVMLQREGLRVPFPPDFVQGVTGARLAAVDRRAKYLLLQLDRGESILAHLGMSGRMTVSKDWPVVPGKHDHVVMRFEDKTLIFNDARRFGVMLLVKDEERAVHPLLAELGPEPLEKEFNSQYLEGRLAAREAPIKNVLMDQKIVVGVGNIYAAEALFLARIHPATPAAKAAKHSELLVKMIQKVLAAAIESGGSSLRDYVRSSGDAGYFQHQFAVYGREGKPCSVCKANIKSIRQAGRSSFFCPSCQS